MSVWRTWSGGENPAPDENVRLRFRDGGESAVVPSDAFRWTWTKLPRAQDIVAYQIAEDSPR